MAKIKAESKVLARMDKNQDINKNLQKTTKKEIKEYERFMKKQNAERDKLIKEREKAIHDTIAAGNGVEIENKSVFNNKKKLTIDLSELRAEENKAIKARAQEEKEKEKLHKQREKDLSNLHKNIINEDKPKKTKSKK